jgi:endonuclease/exonuclease/phosphatase family metal-dependent hydrolase
MARYPKREEEKKALWRMIVGVKPRIDVLAVQEIGGPLYMKELQRDLKTYGVDFPYATTMLGPDQKRQLGVLSDIPFKEIKPHVHLKFPYYGETKAIKRGVLEVTFGSKVGDWKLFVVHLKSRLTEFKGDDQSMRFRYCEAKELKKVIKERTVGYERFALMGDFNDSLKSRVVRLLLRRSKRGSNLQLLRSEDSRGEIWSYFYKPDGSYWPFDLMFLSPKLRLLAGKGHILDIPNEAVKGTDHRLIYVDLDLEGVVKTEQSTLQRGVLPSKPEQKTVKPTQKGASSGDKK